MNVIGLTGRNMPAMADVAEILLDAVTQRALNVAVMLYVQSVREVALIHLNTLGISELWRVGCDVTRPELDHAVDAFISDSASFPDQVRAQLDRFERRLASPSRAVPAAPIAKGNQP